MRADWVYRSRQYLLDGTTTTVNPGGYSAVETTITPGATNSGAFCLLDSVNFTTQTLSPNNALGDSLFISRAGRPEGRGQLILAVQGYLFIRPSSWAIGSHMSGGIRLQVDEQDVDDGILELDADYNIMFPAAAATPSNDPVLFANQKGNLKTWYVYRQFSDNSAILKVPIFWKGRRRLRPQEGLWLHIEVNAPAAASTSSVNWLVTPKLRTLVAIEGDGG